MVGGRRPGARRKGLDELSRDAGRIGEKIRNSEGKLRMEAAQREINVICPLLAALVGC